MRRTRLLITLMALGPGLPGCAVYYFDRATGVEHVWGFSHVVMKATPASGGVSSVVRGHDVLGIALGRDDEGTYLDVGWGRRRRVQVVEDAAFRLEWPSSSFADVRVGEAFPEAALRDGERRLPEGSGGEGD
jgi:hypothetical protein